MLARSRVRPQPVYGFSIGLMSTARPYACCDQFPVPLPQGDGTARRHSKPSLTSPSRGLPTFGP